MSSPIPCSAGAREPYAVLPGCPTSVPGGMGPTPAPVRRIAAAMSSRSSAVSVSDAAPIQPWTCSGARAPTIAPDTPGQASSHAIATADVVVAWRFATGRSASRKVQVFLQLGWLELCRVAPPVVGGERANAIGAEALRQQTRLHGAVADHAGLVARTPRDQVLGSLAVDQREVRLKRVDMPNGFAARQQIDVEVRHARRTNLSLAHEVGHRSP